MSYGLLMRMHSRRSSSWSCLWTGQVNRKCSVVSGLRQVAQSALSRSRILCRPAFVLLCPRRRRVIVVSFRRGWMRYLILSYVLFERLKTSRNSATRASKLFALYCRTYVDTLFDFSYCYLYRPLTHDGLNVQLGDERCSERL